MIHMDLNQLARHLELTRETPHMFFLGAGASVSSGVLSAGLCIQDWKRRLFLSDSPGGTKATATHSGRRKASWVQEALTPIASGYWRQRRPFLPREQREQRLDLATVPKPATRSR